MSTDFNKLTSEFLSGAGAALSSKEADIKKIAESADGKKVTRYIEQNGAVRKALESGDTEKLRQLITSVLSTQEGSRLAQQLADLLK
ncbi:MAG: hypothetical protein GXY20_00545 [Clostridiales bacterium]|nr:hypothetical protein [Clostridiales bacterium]